MGEGKIRIVFKDDFNEWIKWHKIYIINQQLYVMIQYVYTIADETSHM